ncbi:hypothetical protein AB0R12_28915, partial [Streptomyces niveus]|uniref:hypothetical protein n=1 Tax=Streptomyces niveus TaxID=193462 RepID=UPI00343E8653
MRDRWITSTLQMYEGDPRPAHTYVGADGETVTLSRAQLLAAVRDSAGRLVATGLRPGDRVALVAADPGPFVLPQPPRDVEDVEVRHLGRGGEGEDRQLVAT